jgi:hypothetical protein
VTRSALNRVGEEVEGNRKYDQRRMRKETPAKLSSEHNQNSIARPCRPQSSGQCTKMNLYLIPIPTLP